MITDYNHTSFTVTNIDKSIHFYRDILGMKLMSLADRPLEYVKTVTTITLEMKIAYLNGYGLTLELIEYMGSKKNNNISSPDNIGSGHICFNVDDIFSHMESLESKGVRFLGLPTKIPAGVNKGGYVVYSTDPDGIVIEFIMNPLPHK
jgi:lactoylglutathione lyase